MCSTEQCIIAQGPVCMGVFPILLQVLSMKRKDPPLFSCEKGMVAMSPNIKMESNSQAAGLGAVLSARKASSKKYAKPSRDGKVMDVGNSESLCCDQTHRPETNNSSIVSKRSVERLYLEKPHFFRYFVKKPIRRSPLINRGYWLRMHAIEQTVLRFLKEPSEKRKIVINLGCG